MNSIIESLDILTAGVTVVFLTRSLLYTKVKSESQNLANSIKRSLLNQIVTPRL